MRNYYYSYTSNFLLLQIGEVRATEIALRKGCFALDDLTRFTRAEVAEWRGVGEKRLNRYESALAAEGLSFKAEPEMD